LSLYIIREIKLASERCPARSGKDMLWILRLSSYFWEATAGGGGRRWWSKWCGLWLMAESTFYSAFGGHRGQTFEWQRY